MRLECSKCNEYADNPAHLAPGNPCFYSPHDCDGVLMEVDPLMIEQVRELVLKLQQADGFHYEPEHVLLNHTDYDFMAYELQEVDWDWGNKNTRLSMDIDNVRVFRFNDNQPMTAVMFDTTWKTVRGRIHSCGEASMSFEMGPFYCTKCDRKEFVI